MRSAVAELRLPLLEEGSHAFLVVVGTLILWIFSSAVKGDVEGVVEGTFLIGVAFMIFRAFAPMLQPEEDSEESRPDVRNRQSGSNSDQD